MNLYVRVFAVLADKNVTLYKDQRCDVKSKI